MRASQLMVLAIGHRLSSYKHYLAYAYTDPMDYSICCRCAFAITGGDDHANVEIAFGFSCPRCQLGKCSGAILSHAAHYDGDRVWRRRTLGCDRSHPGGGHARVTQPTRDC